MDHGLVVWRGRWWMDNILFLGAGIGGASSSKDISVILLKKEDRKKEKLIINL